MKVSDLLEGEWEVNPIDPRTHLKDFKKRNASMEHHKQILYLKLQALYPDKDMSDVFAPWRIAQLDINDFAPEARKYVIALKKIKAMQDKLSKEEVSAKVNMKYAKHDPELALRHAIGVRRGAYPEGEDAIASTPSTAFKYATEVLRQRFPKGEAAIETDPDLRRQYRHFFFNDFKKGEKWKDDENK